MDRKNGAGVHIKQKRGNHGLTRNLPVFHLNDTAYFFWRILRGVNMAFYVVPKKISLELAR